MSESAIGGVAAAGKSVSAAPSAKPDPAIVKNVAVDPTVAMSGDSVSRRRLDSLDKWRNDAGRPPADGTVNPLYTNITWNDVLRP